jgi:hypothetical protein
LEQFAPGLGGVAEKAGNEEKVSIRVAANTNFFMQTKIYLNSKGRKVS